MLLTALENATDEEIIEANKKLHFRFAKKILLGVVASVVIHFVSEFIAGAIERKINREITD